MRSPPVLLALLLAAVPARAFTQADTRTPLSAKALEQPATPELPHPKPEPKARGRKKPLR